MKNEKICVRCSQNFEEKYSWFKSRKTPQESHSDGYCSPVCGNLSNIENNIPYRYCVCGVKHYSEEEGKKAFLYNCNACVSWLQGGENAGRETAKIAACDNAARPAK